MNFQELSRDEMIADCLAFNLFDQTEIEDLEDWQLEAAIRGENAEQAAIRRLDILADF